MAGGPAKEGGHPAMDYAAHDRTYEGFIHFSMVGTLYCVAVLVCMAIYFTGKSAFWACRCAALHGRRAGRLRQPHGRPLAESRSRWLSRCSSGLQGGRPLSLRTGTGFAA